MEILSLSRECTSIKMKNIDNAKNKGLETYDLEVIANELLIGAGKLLEITADIQHKGAKQNLNWFGPCTIRYKWKGFYQLNNNAVYYIGKKVIY